MAKNSNNLPGLASSTRKRNGALTGAPGLVNSATSAGGSLRIGSSGGTKSIGIGTSGIASSINFGKFPKSANKITPGTNWGALINQAANDGVASLFGGGLNLSGIGSVVSSIASIFGHQKTLPTLTPFQMGPSQDATITVTGGSMTTSTQMIQDQSAQIAQAVKTAVLNSSSLNDILSEI
jgi:hypothetical protein